MNEYLNTILVWFLGIVGTIVTSVIVPQLVSYFKSKTDNEKLKYILTELESTVQTSVDFVNQTFVEQLKADGKFDAENQKQALQMAVEQTIDNLTNKTLDILQSNDIDVEKLVVKYIEAQIKASKK